jgi:hypothetical protein
VVYLYRPVAGVAKRMDPRRHRCHRSCVQVKDYPGRSVTPPSAISFAITSAGEASPAASGSLAFDTATGLAAATLALAAGRQLDIVAAIDGDSTEAGRLYMWTDRVHIPTSNFTAVPASVSAGERIFMRADLRDQFGNIVEQGGELVTCAVPAN